ncbi:MAG: circadian clock protein KaiC [Candidatus Altiarchaeota archaeon]
MTSKAVKQKYIGIEKCRTGIRGLDEITEGGIPRGRPTLICGGAGCGKTLMAMEFIVRGARDLGEPGVFMAFEETEKDLGSNISSLGFDLPALVAAKKVAVDYVFIERKEIEETGEYDLEGLFVRLNSMIDSVGAKRVVLDGLEALFAGLPSEGILRSELRRMFRWLKEKGITAVITAEQGENTLTRHGLEEYVSDCVIYLDNRLQNQVATRRVRIIKYRGSSHGTNEYPALIDEQGFSVLPINTLGLSHRVSLKRIPSGIARLDNMLSDKGYFKGSSILISGTAGSGKTSVAMAYVDSACKRGEKCLYWSSEESPEQIVRNMASIGLDLQKHIDAGHLIIRSIRPTLYGLESHLVNIHKMVSEYKPDSVIMDPVTNLNEVGDEAEIKSMLTRVIDFLKSRGITTIFTSLTGMKVNVEQSEVGVSSLMDTWILLRMVESASERNRIIFVLKSRGMAHSNQMREFILSDHGIDLVDVYEGSGGVFTGTARLNLEAKERMEALASELKAEAHKREVEIECKGLRVQIEALQTKLSNVNEEGATNVKQERDRTDEAKKSHTDMGRARGRDKQKDN